MSITFTALEAATDMDFYIPMPVGEYTGLKVAITGNSLGTYELASTNGATNEITRGKLLLMPTMTCGESSGITLEENSNVSMTDEEEISLNVNDGDKVVVELEENATATLNLTAQNTLVIGEEVTIKELVLKGSNVKQESDITLSFSLSQYTHYSSY